MAAEGKPKVPSSAELSRAATVIREGGIVAFPTETYYGLAVDPNNDRALAALCRLKGREAGKPLLLLIAEQEELAKVAAGVPVCYLSLMERFWPGPLTLVFPAQPHLSPLLTGGSDSIGVRISPHPVAAALCRASRGAITATSANPSGAPPSVRARDVGRYFGRSIDYVLDGGATPGQGASTVVGCRGERLILLRPGVIDFQLVLDCFNQKSRV